MDAQRTPDERVEHTDEFGTIRGTTDVVALWRKIGNDMRSEQQKWIADLRSIGIKAAHPDDGWVDRKKAEHHDFVQFVYPQFDDGVAVGDKIALGWPDRYRVRTVQRIHDGGLIFKTKRYQVVK